VDDASQAQRTRNAEIAAGVERTGSVKGAYVHAAAYKLKADAPNNAVETLSKSFIVPLFEKLMADGTVSAYQVAEESIHAQDPAMFFIFFISPNAEGLDKLNAALSAAISANPLPASTQARPYHASWLKGTP
jgi:hypothetical protein